MRFTALAALILAAIGCDPISPTLITIDDYVRDVARSEMTLAIMLSQRDAIPEPSPRPQPGDKCDNCNGTGKVGDGRVMVTCAVCDGTGVIPAAEPAQQEQYSTITMVTQDGCPPCEKWWREERPKWALQGWRITTIGVAEDGFSVTPSFVIRAYPGGTAVRHEGWLSTRAGKRLLQSNAAKSQASCTNCR